MRAERDKREIDVLVVDDDRDVRTSTAESLGQRGYSVRTAADGAQAIRAVERSTPAVMILDLDMPVMDGREVLAWRRTAVGLWAAIPVILASGRGASEEPYLHGQVGAWLCKPIDIDVLVAAIERTWRSALAALGARRRIAGRRQVQLVKPPRGDGE